MVQMCLVVYVLVFNGGLKTRQKICFYGQKCLVFEWPIYHLIAPFVNWTQRCLISQMLGVQVLGIQMVTVVTTKKTSIVSMGQS